MESDIEVPEYAHTYTYMSVQCAQCTPPPVHQQKWLQGFVLVIPVSAGVFSLGKEDA